MKIVTAALLKHGNSFLIGKRKGKDSVAGKWEFPGGKIEEGESPEECLRREMYEEFQIDIKVKELFAESIYSYETGSIKLLAYWAEWVSGELSPTVHDDYKWVFIDEMSQYDFAPADIPFIEKLRS